MEHTIRPPESPHLHYVGPTADDLARMPAVLKARPQWVVAKLVETVAKTTGERKLDKRPINPRTLGGASTTNPTTWGTFQACAEALPGAMRQWEAAGDATYRGAGLGFVFTPDDPYAFVDPDKSLDDAGTLTPTARDIVDTLNSYAQISVSQHGIHILVEGALPPGERMQYKDLQMWDHGRFCFMTGWHLEGTPSTIEARQGPLRLVHTAHVLQPRAREKATKPPPSKTAQPGQRLTPLREDEILDKARHAANGVKFQRLWNGDWSDYDSQSEGDMALCCLLAFWTRDPAQINTLFRQSGLYRDDKWEREDYQHRTIQAALDQVTDQYDPQAYTSRQGPQQEARQRCNGQDPEDHAGSIAEQAEALLATLRDTPEGDRVGVVYGSMAVLGQLPTAAWAVWLDQARALMGKRLNFYQANRVYKEAATQHRAAKVQAAMAQKQQQDPRVDIQVGTDMSPPVDALQAALLTCTATPLYQRGRFICHIGAGGPPLKWLQRPPDMPQILLTSAPHLRELASKAAQFWVEDVKTGLRLTRPPLHVIDTLMARPGWDFPLLEGIVNVPTLCPDGTLLIDQGYDADSGLYVDFNGVTFPPLPARPDKAAAQQAIAFLKKEVFCDFLWANEKVHVSATLAALLSCVCRYAILGHVPMFAVRATTRGSGKGKLIDVISLIATGRTAPRVAQTMDEEEERKRLLAVALAGLLLLHIDNVSHPLGSGPLDLALTSPTFGDRMLGKNEQREAPMTCVFFSSGNNMQFKSDTARRVIPIDLDPKMEHPEQRTGFRQDDLEAWVLANRPHLVMAALTIVKAYMDCTDKPATPAPLGSYEQWSNLIRAALIWAGEVDPCDARLGIEAESDPQYERRDQLLEAWERCYASQAVTLNLAQQDISQRAMVGPNEWNDLRDALGAFDRHYDGTRFNARVVGDALRAMCGVVMNDRSLIKGGKFHGAVQWKIERLAPVKPHEPVIPVNPVEPVEPVEPQDIDDDESDIPF
jgi:primase-polymerase (primpol)-like protein